MTSTSTERQQYKACPKFALGQVVATRGVLSLFDWTELSKLISRHVNGDWGEMCGEDKQKSYPKLIKSQPPRKPNFQPFLGVSLFPTTPAKANMCL